MSAPAAHDADANHSPCPIYAASALLQALAARAAAAAATAATQRFCILVLPHDDGR
jgi:hypothetical protein